MVFFKILTVLKKSGIRKFTGWMMSRLKDVDFFEGNKPKPHERYVYRGVADDSVNTGLLSPKDKRYLWEGIKKTSPELAGLLVDDETIKQLKARFGAFVVFTPKEAGAFIDAGKQI